MNKQFKLLSERASDESLGATLVRLARIATAVHMYEVAKSPRADMHGDASVEHTTTESVR